MFIFLAIFTFCSKFQVGFSWKKLIIFCVQCGLSRFLFPLTLFQAWSLSSFYTVFIISLLCSERESSSDEENISVSVREPSSSFDSLFCISLQFSLDAIGTFVTVFSFYFKDPFNKGFLIVLMVFFLILLLDDSLILLEFCGSENFESFLSFPCFVLSVGLNSCGCR